MNALDVFLQSVTCRKCGAIFETRDARVRYCSDECRPHNRAEVAAKMRMYRMTLDPETQRRLNHERYIAGGGKEALYKSRSVTCTTCGSVRQRNDLSAASRENYICWSCQILARRALLPPSGPCRICAKPAGYGTNNQPRRICIDCKGVQVALAEQLDVTHQRVSQMIATEIEHARKRGRVITQADAIDVIRHMRGLA